MKLDLHYIEPRLVELYDTDNPHGPDTDFYIALANTLHAKTIVDLGCGTGLLTRQLATDNRRVIGVDPAPAMLAYARRQAGAERVEWIEGDANAIGTPAADLVLMTGNVAQVFLSDDEWNETLRLIHAGLRVGGCVAFESRNPQARAWEQWIPSATYEQSNTPFGRLECWLELVSVADEIVHFQGHNRFIDSDEVLIIDSKLRFRSESEIVDSLTAAGFVLEQRYGDWHHGSLTDSSRVMVFVARRK